MNAIKAKDYSSGNKSTTTPVQPIFKNKDSVELKKNGESKIDNIAREPGSSASTQNILRNMYTKEIRMKWQDRRQAKTSASQI